jgi:hypothetical protein
MPAVGGGGGGRGAPAAKATGLAAEEFAAARRTMNEVRDNLIRHAQQPDS